MKNKLLWYLLGGLLAILLNFSYWYVHADCADQCKNTTSDATEYTTCMAGCNTEKDWWTLFGEEGVVVAWDASKSKKKECKDWCCGIKLNTNFPIIWNCIWGKGKTDSTTAFPTMIWALTKIVMSLVLVACFILIIYAGILWSADKPKEAKERLKRVAITILLLWFSGVILRLINPNFFS